MTIYNFSLTKTNGTPVPLSDYSGKVLLIVNTASKCSFTPQFDDLQHLYDDYKASNFEILGVPCNQFGEQEPGTNEQAASFCQINYGVKFSIFAKEKVNGPDAHPLFGYLKQEAPFQGFDETDVQAKLLKMMIAEKNPEWLVGDSIKWNFTKFLIDQNGKVVRRYEPIEEFSVLREDIETLLEH